MRSLQYAQIPLGPRRAIAVARAVREHRDRGLDHRHRIAVRDHDRRVREGGEQRAELLEVLRRLQHPALARPHPLEDLEHRLHVRVVRRLVVAEVVVAPARRAHHPFLVVAGEVRELELDLLVDVVGAHRVHRRHQRRGRLHAGPGALRARVARIHAARARWLARIGHGLLPLPERHRAQPLVRGDQVHEVRGARARQAHHDDRPADLDLVDLGVALQQVADAEPVRRRAQRVVPDREAAEARALGVLVHLFELEREAFPEVVGRRSPRGRCASRPPRARRRPTALPAASRRRRAPRAARR